MNDKFDFDTAAALTEDALHLLDAVDELLVPLTQSDGLGEDQIIDLSHRARMIDATLRAARRNAHDALLQYRSVGIAIDATA